MAFMCQFYIMAIHIGNIIYKLKKERKIDNIEIAEAVNVQYNSVFKIYKNSSLDPEKLIALSILLKENLFNYYFEDNEDFKSLFNRDIQDYITKITEMEKILEEKEDRISNLKVLLSEKEDLIKILREKLDMLSK